MFSRAVQTVSSALRRKGNAGGIYAPAGSGGWGTLFSFSGIGNRATGQVQLNESERLQNNVGVVHTAVLRIAEDVSSLKVTVEISKRGGRWVADPQHPLQQLLTQPVPWAEGTELRHVLQQHLCLLGRAAVLVVDGTHGQPRELHLLYPQRLDALPDPVNFISQYRYQGLGGMQQYFPAFTTKPDPSGLSVLEVRIPEPTNPYGGNSAVQAGSNSITLDSEIRAYARFYFANNAVPGAVLESDQAYPGPVAAQAQKDSWNEQYQGVYNAGKLAPLWGGLKLKSIAPAFKDLAFPEITRATRQDILMHFGVPGPVLGYTDTGALGADTFSAARSVYQSQTLDPHRKRLERFFNRLATRWPGCRVVIESPVDDDLARLEKRRLDETGAGLLSRKEYRAAAGYEEDGQPDVWTMPRGTQVYHGLAPEDIAEPVAGETAPAEAQAPPEDKGAVAARYRTLWASEYRRLKHASETERPHLPAEFAQRWAAEGESLATLAGELRLAALNRSGGDLAKAYEALKAEASALAEAR
ncbi:phage portal protein [Deinococcus rubellus]|uniref:Phage portal protein n=1 Tax=Deinococcus rubellus TaxID=1889240 RepID=A0ABY5YGK4_9DEIO|nr:phage portal protein [Deinococcus rubellus]UWX64188.1 phage portal protein [Deinococcus rubellus]